MMPYKLLNKYPKTMLNKGTGFLADYTHSLNPYTGCSFGCAYCYVRGMPVSTFRGEEWGSWIDIKKEAAGLLEKELVRAKSKGKVTIFMSSSTDPYQPVEVQEKVTRSLLEVMAVNPPDFLLVQTRSPLVQRDLDLFLKLKERVRISMTIETDLDEIRKQFSPSAPPIPARLKALGELAKSGVPVQAAIAPVLPSSAAFPDVLRSVVDRVCLDDYFMGDGSGGRRTRGLGIGSIYEKLGLEDWYGPSAYRIVYERLLGAFDEAQIRISREGFAP